MPRRAGTRFFSLFFSLFSLPLLPLPQIQYDMFNLMYDTDNYAPATPAQFAFVQQFQNQTRALIAELPPSTGVYAPTCLVHCLSGQATYNQLTTAGMTMADVLNAWYFQGGKGGRLISKCVGWNCTQACGVGSGYLNSGLPCNAGSPNCTAIVMATSDHSTDGAPVPPPAPTQSADVVVGDEEDHILSKEVSAVEPSLTAAQQAKLSSVVSAVQSAVSAASPPPPALVSSTSDAASLFPSQRIKAKQQATCHNTYSVAQALSQAEQLVDGAKGQAMQVTAQQNLAACLAAADGVDGPTSTS